MTKFDRIVFEEYLEYLNNSFNNQSITYNLMLNPSNRVIEEMTILIYKILKNESDNVMSKAMDSIDIDYDSEIYRQESSSASHIAYRDYCIGILESTMTYLLLRPSKEGNELRDYILNNNINEVIDRFNEDISFAQFIILFYIKYLVSKKYLTITEKEEEQAWVQYDCLKNLCVNKGYLTINDIVRNSLMEMINDIKETYYDEDIVCHMIDEFFETDIRDVYLKQNGIDLSNFDYVKMLKKYIVRVVLSDAYIDLKVLEHSSDFEVEEEMNDIEDTMELKEIEAMNYIEKAAENEEFSLPEDFEMRKEIYLHFHFYNSNSEIDRTEDLNSLGDCVKTIKRTNPLCYLDM